MLFAAFQQGDYPSYTVPIILKQIKDEKLPERNF